MTNYGAYGPIKASELFVTGNSAVTGTLTVTGASTLTGAQTLTGATTMSGALGLSSTLVQTVAALGANARAARFLYTCAVPAMSDGYGAHEIDLTVTGTATGIIAATSTWINLGTSAVVPTYAHVHTDGIWDGTATLTNANISWAKYQCILSSDPAVNTLWTLNFSGANSEVDALFQANDATLALGYQAGTPTKAAVGSIPFHRDTNGAILYIYLYDAADSD